MAIMLVSCRPVYATPPQYDTHIEMPGLPESLVLSGEGAIPVEALETFVRLAGGADATIVTFGVGRSEFPLPGVKEVIRVDLSSSSDDPAIDLEAVAGCWIESSVVLDGPEIELSHLTQITSVLGMTYGHEGIVGASGEWTRNFITMLPGMKYGSDSPEQGLFNLDIAERSAVLISGRRGRVFGDGVAAVTLAASANRPVRQMSFAAGEQFDLIALSRAAVARAGEAFPPRVMRDPVVESGTLFIGGGGPMPEEGMQHFIAASGGPDAPIVIIPTAIGRPDAATFGERNADQLRALGANNVSVMHTMNPREADTEEFCAPLREAGGIWFTGGRQWNLVDAYRGTLAHELMHNVLKRGGAIGGSSAGASIQAEYMVRGHPLGNAVMMAEGYERGLDFLPGVAIDQHFAQRDRFKDLASVKHAFPQLLCLGIDEQTMLIVRDSVAEVVGPHNLQVYADPVPDDFDGAGYVKVKPGERYDLKARRKLSLENQSP
jgi:cyanophycinase